MGLRGYRAYPTNDGINHLPLIWSDNTARETTGPGAGAANPQFMIVLDKHCPPDTSNSDWVRIFFHNLLSLFVYFPKRELHVLV